MRPAVWRDPEALKALLVRAADGFVKHEDGSVQIWAADRDWFLEEWGRDTFLSLPGLLLTTGRFEEAKENLRRFARFEREGLIPNRITSEGAEYNTSDAPMWFVQAVRRTAETSGEEAFALEMAPVARRVLERYRDGTGYQRYQRFNRIFMDSDGLIVTPAQSSWMDADPDGLDRPVTPRNGKAVEINALWYANLRFLASLERRLGNEAAARSWEALAGRVKESFNLRFWNGRALRDVVDGDPHGEAVRPNMLIAVSVGGDLLSPERQRAVVEVAARELLTRYGLRTLSYRDPAYCERYDTSQPPLVKDQAYHQGTAWPWLLGPYVDALATVRRHQGWSEARVQAEVRALATPLLEFLVTHPEGTIPEVFDGGPGGALESFSVDDPAGLANVFAEPSTQKPGGTRSQAWSVAEVLRVLVEHGGL